MKRGREFSRRTLLKGLTAAGLIFPTLPSLRSAFAAPTKPPKRLVLFFSPNGTVPDFWIPNGTETSFTFKEILKPLDALKKKLLIIEGLGFKIGGPGDSHQKGMGQLFTGSELLPGDTKGGCKTCAPVSWAGHASVDQAIANYLLQEAKKNNSNIGLRSIEFGVQVKNNNVWTRMCYRGPKLPISPQNDPYQAFKDLFGGTQDQQKLVALRIQRKSVLDGVLQELSTLKNELANDDQKRLEEHLNNVREIERQLESTTTSTSAACASPTQGTPVKYMENKNFPAVGKLQMDLLAMSIICNKTQVTSIQWDRSVGNAAFTWLGITQGHHTISHASDTDKTAKNNLIKINNWYAKQYAYLVNKLDSAVEGTGSVLDNTLVVWGNELGKGNSHTLRNIPFVIAGNADGFFKSGRYFKVSDKPHNHLLISLCHAMGYNVDTFGDNRFRGPLSLIHA